MKLCRYSLTPLSPWSGWLRSDTIYGLICWNMAESEGEAACASLIEAFGANQPPFLLSSAMPAGYLPMPILPAPSREKFRGLAAGDDGSGEKLFAALKRFKKFRKSKWLAASAWQRHKAGLDLATLFLDSPEAAAKPLSETAFEPHVAIDRATGAARAGQLFFTRLRYFQPEAKLDLYARCEDPDWLLKKLRLIGDTGFGQNASTGNGRFDAELDGDFDAEAFELPEASACLLCSACAAPDMTGLDGYYRVEVKRAKTGPGNANPFKKPFLMLEEGSVLTRRLPGPFVLRDLNADRRVVQIMQPLTLPCRLAEARKS